MYGLMVLLEKKLLEALYGVILLHNLFRKKFRSYRHRSKVMHASVPSRLEVHQETEMKATHTTTLGSTFLFFVLVWIFMVLL